MRLTFRKQPRTTASSWQGKRDTDIKLDGRIVGLINAPSRMGKGWSAQVAVKSNKSKCGWEWMTTVPFDNEDELRAFVKRTLVSIVEEIELHYFNEES